MSKKENIVFSFVPLKFLRNFNHELVEGLYVSSNIEKILPLDYARGKI